jgi:ATP-binding cassette subfamily C protein
MGVFRHLRALVTDILSVVGIKWVLYVLLLAITGLAEAVSLASAVPLLAAARIGGKGPEPEGSLAGVAVAVLHMIGVNPTVTTIGVFVLAALAVSTLLFLTQAYVGASLQTTYVYRWQQRLISAIFAARWGYLSRCRSGDLISAVITETQRLGGAFYQSGLLLTGLLHGVVFLVVAAVLSGPITFLVTAGGAVLFLLTRPFILRAYRLGHGISRENATLQTLAGELVPGAKLVKATATEAHAAGLLNRSADRLRRHYRANTFDVQVVKAVFDFGAGAIGAGIVIASDAMLGGDPAVTIVVLAISVRLMPKLTGLQHSLQSLALSAPAVELLRGLETEARAHGEIASTASLPERLRDGPLAVRLRDVAVYYGATAALRGVSLEIPAGACVALVGGSGAGKSTLVDAVIGLVDLTDGAIAVNGVPLQELPLASLRRRIGYVGQETVLYNASIRDNILWGRSSSTAEALLTATRLAGADGFITSLNGGYETPVGDRGLLLSGGERQRVGLARAAVGYPGLLILDEATSALDAETERVVTDALAPLKGSTTIIIIAHRLSTVRIADTIYVMEAGRIVEHGSWDELIRRGGRLYELWRLQYEKEGTSVDA